MTIYEKYISNQPMRDGEEMRDFFANDKIPVYDVQTVYGTEQKTFQHIWNASAYKIQLEKDYDRDLIEVKKRNVTRDEFCLEDLAD